MQCADTVLFRSYSRSHLIARSFVCAGVTFGHINNESILTGSECLMLCLYLFFLSHTVRSVGYLIVKATTAETQESVKPCLLGAIRRIQTSAGSIAKFPSVVSVMRL